MNCLTITEFALSSSFGEYNYNFFEILNFYLFLKSVKLYTLSIYFIGGNSAYNKVVIDDGWLYLSIVNEILFLAVEILLVSLDSLSTDKNLELVLLFILRSILGLN